MIERRITMELVSLVARSWANSLECSELQVAYQQRAKFEGWLKVELAAGLAKAGAKVTLEWAFLSEQSDRYHADLRVQLRDEEQVLLMLKTVNTNFRFPGVTAATRPISQNISEVIQDLKKLRADTTGAYRCAAFPVFPVDSDELKRAGKLGRHLGRITTAGGTIEQEGFVRPASSDGS